jgi:hypothetical protein
MEFGWRKSSRSHGGECVEVSGTSEGIGIRDSKDRAGATLKVGRSAWSRFVDAVKEERYPA